MSRGKPENLGRGKGRGRTCPACGSRVTGVDDTRHQRTNDARNETTTRKRRCYCGHKWTTVEADASLFKLIKLAFRNAEKQTKQRAARAEKLQAKQQSEAAQKRNELMKLVKRIEAKGA